MYRLLRSDASGRFAFVKVFFRPAGFVIPSPQEKSFKRGQDGAYCYAGWESFPQPIFHAFVYDKVEIACYCYHDDDSHISDEGSRLSEGCGAINENLDSEQAPWMSDRRRKLNGCKGGHRS